MQERSFFSHYHIQIRNLEAGSLYHGLGSLILGVELMGKVVTVNETCSINLVLGMYGGHLNDFKQDLTCPFDLKCKDEDSFVTVLAFGVDSRKNATVVLLDHKRKIATQSKDSLIKFPLIKFLTNCKGKDGTIIIRRDFSFVYLNDCRIILEAWINKLLPDPYAGIS